jgi:beta-lactamase regulating signal transducer with metallopeptidase domain
MTSLVDFSVPWALLVGSEMLVKGSIVLAIAGTVTAVARKASAASRHAVWSISLGALLILPALAISLPAWNVSGMPVVTRAANAVIPERKSTVDRSVTLANTEASETAVAAATGTSQKHVSGFDGKNLLPSRTVPPFGSVAATIVLVVWAAGACFLLLRFVFATNHVRALSRRAIAGRAGGGARTVPVRSRFGVPDSVTVVSSDEVSMPMCWGLFKPVVILPASAERWPSGRKSAVMLHEIAHATRCDYLALLVGEIARAIYWPNPLVWLAVRRAAMEREHACDDEALNVGIRSDVYAKHLMEVVRAQTSGMALNGAIAMAGRSNLKTRMGKILTRGLSRRPVSRGDLLAVALIAAFVTVPVAALELSAEDAVTVATSSRIRLQGPRSVMERIQELRSDDASVRRYAAWALGEMEDDRAVSPLHESLRDDDADVRLVAAWALGEIKHPRSVEPLIEVLDDEDSLVREMAVLALGEIEDSRAVGPLMEAVERDEALGEPVIWALGEIDTRRANEARDVVFDAIGYRPWDNTEVWAGEWLGWDGPRRLRELATLERALTDRDPEIRQYAAWEMGHLDDERAVESLLDLLRDDDPATRAMAIWALDETNPSRQRRRVAD